MSNIFTESDLLKGSKGILYCSGKGTSGYAEVSKRVVYQLSQQDIPISWHQFTVDDSKYDENDPIYQVSKKTISQNIEFDTAIFCCTPDLWFKYIERFKIKFINKRMIGYTTWETNKLTDLFVKYCNLMGEIWVPSIFNKEVFERCGVDVPIKVVPYPFIKQPLPDVNIDSLRSLLTISKWYGNKSDLFKYGPDWKVFYTIGEWNDRKNLESTVRTFCETFTVKDRVKLIIKTFHLDYTEKNKKWCVDKLENILVDFKDPPEILLITDNITDNNLRIIHSVGDCYYSMTRGEGFYLSAFDAFNYNKDVIISSFGGQCDYLGKSYKGYIGYELVNVDFKEREIIYDNRQKWANPSVEDASVKLQTVYSNNQKRSSDFVLLGDELKDICYKNSQKIVNRTNVVVADNLKTEKIKLSNITVKDDVSFKGIHYIGQFGTCGYASAAKRNLFYFFNKGVPITWTPLYFDNSSMSDDCMYNIIVKSLIKKELSVVDSFVFHCTPDLWPEMNATYKVSLNGKKKIGYTVWETDKLPISWAESINEFVDEVWCPSTYNKTVFENSGITIPIKIFPHPFLEKELPNKNHVFIKTQGELSNVSLNDYYTFYNIGELTPRKGIEDLVKVFCDVFTNKDKVRLILKVHFKNYDDVNKQYCIDTLSNVVKMYNNPPVIQYILDNVTEKEILGLHSIGDCYVSLCKSEGFGLTIFEAYKYGKNVIATGYSGHVDFLGSSYKGLVNYKLGNVTEMFRFSKYYSEDQHWAYPDLDHAGELMRSVTK